MKKSYKINLTRLGRENYRPTRNCTENEVECTNSYFRKICVKEEVKDVACAKYSKRLCYDEAVHIPIIKTTDDYLFNITNNQYVTNTIYIFINICSCLVLVMIWFKKTRCCTIIKKQNLKVYH